MSNSPAVIQPTAKHTASVNRLFYICSSFDYRIYLYRSSFYMVLAMLGTILKSFLLYILLDFDYRASWQEAIQMYRIQKAAPYIKFIFPNA